MAGCEYLENIERVGLKVALKHFRNHKNFESVVAFLKKSSTFKARIQDDYIDKAKKVATLFKYQTVYDLRSGRLT
jgi:5'-3' exonuclease